MTEAESEAEDENVVANRRPQASKKAKLPGINGDCRFCEWERGEGVGW